MCIFTGDGHNNPWVQLHNNGSRVQLHNNGSRVQLHNNGSRVKGLLGVIWVIDFIDIFSWELEKKVLGQSHRSPVKGHLGVIDPWYEIAKTGETHGLQTALKPHYKPKLR